MTAALGRSRVGRERFERIYEGSEDPWGYTTSEYERAKYADTIAALPPRVLGTVLEVGCSIGVFTALLAPRCRRLVAIDFSSRALEIARERLADAPRVELKQASFPEQAPNERFDLIICSEVLYYLDLPAFTRAVDWLGARLADGASVLAVSWRGQGREEPMTGDEAHDRLTAAMRRWHVLDARHDGYRLDRFDGDGA
ncbi:MAG: class I SAM-dependent DNA methyltransferase [Solirubrobacteraceae bacterium]